MIYRHAVIYRHKPKIENYAFHYSYAAQRKEASKKIPRVMKEELLASVIEIESKDEPELEEAVKIVRDPKEANQAV